MYNWQTSFLGGNCYVAFTNFCLTFNIEGSLKVFIFLFSKSNLICFCHFNLFNYIRNGFSSVSSPCLPAFPFLLHQVHHRRSHCHSAHRFLLLGTCPVTLCWSFFCWVPIRPSTHLKSIIAGSWAGSWAGSLAGSLAGFPAGSLAGGFTGWQVPWRVSWLV